jgi:hypothetical protein
LSLNFAAQQDTVKNLLIDKNQRSESEISACPLEDQQSDIPVILNARRSKGLQKDDALCT